MKILVEDIKVQLRLFSLCHTPGNHIFTNQLNLLKFLSGSWTKLVGATPFCCSRLNTASSEVNCLPHLPSKAVLGSSSHLGSIAASTALVLLSLVFEHKWLDILSSKIVFMVYPPGEQVSGSLTIVHGLAAIRAQLALNGVVHSTAPAVTSPTLAWPAWQAVFILTCRIESSS